MTVTAAVELAEFKAYLQKSGDADDAALTRALKAATRTAETNRECGIGPIVHQTLTKRVDAESYRAILPVGPVVSVTSATHVDTGLAVTVEDVDVDLGLIRVDTNGVLSVVYVAGRAETVAAVEEDIREAVCIIGKHLWETRRGSPAARGGALTQESPPDERVPAGFLIPHRARAILQGRRDFPMVG